MLFLSLLLFDGLDIEFNEPSKSQDISKINDYTRLLSFFLGFWCHVSYVRCHVSVVMCHVSPVTLLMSLTPKATAMDPSPTNSLDPYAR